MKKMGNILWGIVLIVVGLIIGGNALEITNINLFFTGWWTLFIIIPCFIGLIKDNEKTGSIIGLLIGFGLLLASRGIINFRLLWKLFLPIILVVVGLSIIFKDILGGKINEKIKQLNKKLDKDNSFCATFSAQKVKIDAEEFKGSDLTAVFGGVEYDLRKSIIKSDVVINATAIFGGIDILVPSNVKVKIKSTSIFGGIDNKTSIDINEESYTIYINGIALFGGVEVK